MLFMARARTRRSGSSCTTITFKRAHKGGRILPRSQWRTVTRCKSRKLKAHNRRQCRVGGKGPRAHLFASCTGRRARARG